MSWASRFPVYQVDFQAAASGKRVASTKRRIRWRFGFPNRQALDEGRTGIDCRGEEHDIVIVWSITSGKRQILMDGQEVHYSVSRSGVLEHSWPSKGNHVMKIIAHAAPPLSATPGFRQYDFLVDGQSYFLMPKVYELGLRRSSSGYDRSPSAYGQPSSYPPSHANDSRQYVAQAPRTREEEEAALQRAITASLEESRKYLERNHPVTDDQSIASAPQPQAESTGDLLGFSGPRAINDAQSIISYSSMPPSQNSATYAPTYSAPAGTTYPAGAPGTYPGAAPGSYPPPAASSYPAQPPSTYPAQGAAPYAPPPPSSYPATAQPAYPAQPTPTYPVPAAPGGEVPLLTNGSAAPSYQQPPASSYSQPVPTHPQAPSVDAFAPQAPYVDAFAPPAPSSDVFGLHQQPLPPAGDPFAPKPPPPPMPVQQTTHNDIANAIMGAYQSGSPAGPIQSDGQSPPGQVLSLENGEAKTNGHGSNVKLTMHGGFSDGAVQTVDEEPKNDFDVAMKKLVNIDRINEPVEQMLTLDMKKALEEKEKEKHRHRSHPLPPAAQGMVGSQASLNQIKTVKPETQRKTENIMKQPPQLFHPNAAMAGALVVHGEGPPPLQPQGFGVGYRQGYQYRS